MGHRGEGSRGRDDRSSCGVLGAGHA